MSAINDLENMIMCFRVSDLQVLLGFAGRNKTGKKQELQARALDLVKLKSQPVEMKIKELYNRRYHNQLLTRSSNYDNIDRTLTDHSISNYESSINSNYSLRCNPNTRPMSVNQGLNPSYPGKSYLPPVPPQPPTYYSPYTSNVKFKDLPFNDVIHVLLKPFNLIPDPIDRNQDSKEKTYSFKLQPQEAHDIAVSKDAFGNYECQILLRFCILDSTSEQEDNFPPNISLKVNGKNVPLPNPIPTNRPGVEPKRPSKPVNITPFTKLSPTVTNIITISWSSNYGQSYAAELTVVKVVSSNVLLQRLKNRGCRDAEHSKAMIIDKLRQDQDADIATTSLQASLICPLGKLKMQSPCRATTCSHIACFDASLYIQLNEKKPKWRCPVCDKPALFRDLFLDGLFMEIVSQVPSECTDVQLQDDGSWTPVLPVKKPKEAVKKLDVEVAEKKPSKPVECVDLGSDSDTEDTWKVNQRSLNSESPPIVFIPPETSDLPQCLSPPLPVFSPSATVYDADFEPVVEPVPVCLTSNVLHEQVSSEHLKILPDIIPPSSNSELGSTNYSPYPNSCSAFGASTNNAFSEQLTSDDKQNSDSIKNFDFYSLLQPLPPSEQQNHLNEFSNKESNAVETELNQIPDVISLD